MVRHILKQLWGRKIMTGIPALMVLVVIAGTGCPCPRGWDAEESIKPQQPPEPDKKEVSQQSQDLPCTTRKTEDGNIHLRTGIPNGSGQEETVFVERITPQNVSVGEVFSYKIILKNKTNCSINDVVLTEKTSPRFNLKSTTPEAEITEDGNLRWQIKPLAPDESRTFIVSGVSEMPGDLKHCADAEFSKRLCSRIRAIQPELKLTKNMPEEVKLSEQIPIRLTVKNTGTGKARAVRVKDKLPTGLSSKTGKTSFVFDAGDLETGESREFLIIAEASETGVFENEATAEAKGDITASASDNVRVRAPKLKITKDGTDEQYAGRTVTYSILIKNTGDAAADQVIVTDTFPESMEFVRASGDGTRSSVDTVKWRFALAPQAEKTLNLTLRAAQTGNYTNKAVASTTAAETVSASAKTEVIGVPATLLEVIDKTDPLEVGEEGVYVIAATNQGTVSSTDVEITCELENNMSYVSSGGPTQAAVEDGQISFAPLPELEAGEKAVWQVKVKAESKGDVRFKSLLRSNHLKRPVEETEATTIY